MENSSLENNQPALQQTDVSSSANAQSVVVEQCPEFPFFGAWYPDARCIDGNLHDMDKCDEDGRLYEAGEYNPCPFCRQDEFIERYIDEENGVTKADVLSHIESIKLRWG
ncbi:MAG: hypothetical protein EOO14_00420 [Chitinophagaceae bacterium]|nr:MAG: hypothetical protein EOO14_00420 [Chitinophagaceae bacterium]